MFKVLTSCIILFEAAIGFPLIILLLVPIRMFLVPRLPFTIEELAVLDGPTASPFVSHRDISELLRCPRLTESLRRWSLSVGRCEIQRPSISSGYPRLSSIDLSDEVRLRVEVSDGDYHWPIIAGLIAGSL